MSQLRTCLRLPVPEIQVAASLLDEAATAHLNGDRARVRDLIAAANMPAVRDWTESLWGAKSPYAPKFRKDAARQVKVKERMPSPFMQSQLHKRDGYRCRYCGAPVIRKVIREFFRRRYPELNLWGRRNLEQHAAFQALWAQYDHVVPHSVGGANDMDNLVVTCAPCNFAKMDFTLEEAALEDPRRRAPAHDCWDGLERVLAHAT